MKISDIHHLFIASAGVSTDTRTTLKDKLFFALKGLNFDGNTYAGKALEGGARYAVVDDENLPKKKGFIFVDNSLQTLQQLATYHRRYLNLPLIAITGSNGKTTTKELTAAILSRKYNVAFTRGNLNNHIGVPLTLLRMNKATEIGVVEMGANHQREIAGLCEIARPDYGYITNYGKAHLEGFGGVEGVIKGKSELYDFLKAHDKKLIVNADDPLEMKQSTGGNRMLFTQGDKADCQIKFKSANPFVSVEFSGETMQSHLLGDYNAKNIAAAVCMGNLFAVKPQAIKEAVETYRPDNNRSQIIDKGKYKIILDAYNANPTSMRLALQNFEDFPGTVKVAVLGDMFEIGKTAVQEHQKIIDWLEESAITKAFVCGETFAKTNTKSVRKFVNFDALKEAVSANKPESATFLIKGSRGMAMERLLAVLE